jgi:hypothetical protein
MSPCRYRTPLARFEPGHVLPDGLNYAGHIAAGNGILGGSESQTWDDEAQEVRQSGHHVPNASVDTGRMHPHQDFVVFDLGLIDVA